MLFHSCVYARLLNHLKYSRHKTNSLQKLSQKFTASFNQKYAESCNCRASSVRHEDIMIKKTQVTSFSFTILSLIIFDAVEAQVLSEKQNVRIYEHHAP